MISFQVSIDNSSPFLPYFLGGFPEYCLHLIQTVICQNINENILSLSTNLLRAISDIVSHDSKQFLILF
jgi:hypothetical protein